ncbi:Conserved_hypothetical protein [Hexamita inflata]|uniref:Uncharacterized protein n=1 Tax=Hexamita inflata TaxID=28002 RepID=A0AA86Q163_9EUKA|nr:Conserved hypothetical protein [Hexamita inflata]
MDENDDAVIQEVQRGILLSQSLHLRMKQFESVMNDEEDENEQLDKPKVKKSLQSKNRVPTFNTDHSLAAKIAHSTHLKREKMTTRLPKVQSITPSPLDTQVTREQMNLLSNVKHTPSFTLSSRYDHTRDFAKTTFTPVGPNSYEVSREKLLALSTTKQPKLGTFSVLKQPAPETAGPGPGKYDTRNLFKQTSLQSQPRFSIGAKSEALDSNGLKYAADMPAPGDYILSRPHSQSGFKYNLREKGRFFERPSTFSTPGMDTPGFYQLRKYD